MKQHQAKKEELLAKTRQGMCDITRGNLIKTKFYPIYTKLGGHLENDDSNHQSKLKNKKNHQNANFTGYNFLPSWFIVGKWPVRH